MQGLGAEVIIENSKTGFVPATMLGLKRALEQGADLVIFSTYPYLKSESIPKIAKPILNHEADLVLCEANNTRDGICALNRKAIERVLEDWPHFQYSQLLLQFSDILLKRTKNSSCSDKFTFT